jgi:hypothetical protein
MIMQQSLAPETAYRRVQIVGWLGRCTSALVQTEVKSWWEGLVEADRRAREKRVQRERHAPNRKLDTGQ